MPFVKAKELNLSDKEKEILEEIIRKKSSFQAQVIRAEIILAASKNKENIIIAEQLKLNRKTVKLWRDKWFRYKDKLSRNQIDDKHLKKLILNEILIDEQRSGIKAIFTIEQITKIIALACERPEYSGYPTSHWTIRELREEILKREIVKEISWSSIQRFLKSGGIKAS